MTLRAYRRDAAFLGIPAYAGIHSPGSAAFHAVDPGVRRDDAAGAKRRDNDRVIKRDAE